MQDAAPALVAGGPGEAAPRRPPAPLTVELRTQFDQIGAPFTTTRAVADEAFCLAALALAEAIPARAAAIAVWEGVPREVAERIFASMVVAAAILVDELTAEAGITWRRGADHHAMPPAPDWPALEASVR